MIWFVAYCCCCTCSVVRLLWMVWRLAASDYGSGTRAPPIYSSSVSTNVYPPMWVSCRHRCWLPACLPCTWLNCCCCCCSSKTCAFSNSKHTAVLRERQQTELPDMMMKIFNEIQNEENVEIKLNYITLDRDNLFESYDSCKCLNFLNCNSSCLRDLCFAASWFCTNGPWSFAHCFFSYFLNNA